MTSSPGNSKDSTSTFDGELSIGSTIELTTSSMANGGSCVAHAPDGRVIFVRHSLPDEQLIARITQINKSFYRADAIEIITASPARVSPPCKYAGPGRCGGCDFQHVDLATQRQLKAALIATQLERLAKIETEVVVERVPGDDDGLGWRTRTRFAIDRDGSVTYRKAGSHDLIKIDRCLIATDDVEALRVESQRWEGVAELEVITIPGGASASNQQSSIVVVHTENDRKSLTLPHFERSTTEIVVESPRKRERSHLTIGVKDQTFRVTSNSFWQIHEGAAPLLVDAVLEGLQPRRGERVLDLYSGVGLFTKFLSVAVGTSGNVVAVESSKSAASDAKHNTGSLKSVEIRQERVSVHLLRGLPSSDIIVIDPPRAGIGQTAMRALIESNPTARRIAYVSCDAATFARDVAVAVESGWHLAQMRAFDLFPMTAHVEILGILEPSA